MPIIHTLYLNIFIFYLDFLNLIFSVFFVKMIKIMIETSAIAIVHWKKGFKKWSLQKFRQVWKQFCWTIKIMQSAQTDCQNIKSTFVASSMFNGSTYYYFDGSAKLFSDLYLAKFLHTSAKQLFSHVLM